MPLGKNQLQSEKSLPIYSMDWRWSNFPMEISGYGLPAF